MSSSANPAEMVSIWRATGKEPSPLWQGEVNSFNDIFSDLAEYFEQHETYCYSFRSWDVADNAVHTHSTLTMGRIAKWLEHYGLVTHSTEKRKASGDDKPVLFHVLKAALRLREVFEKGELIKLGRSYTDPQVVGIGKPYSSYHETVKWLESNYEQHKVAKYRRQNWWGDFNRLYNENVGKTKEEMHKLMTAWLYQQIASIPVRGRKALAREKAFVAEQGGLIHTSENEAWFNAPRTKPLTDFFGGPGQ
jgi:hypothetical protein